ncbi:hypothetical protein MFIFM68171_09057 [Madurella fahalii]|uniref:Uncharacterized protein n=1 Tax=Madurella fahalii TaxID=1157608 RepID=A0ABQ0GM61_9PEZI
MANLDSPQFECRERDLRSARKEWKRTKDSNAKWSNGSRHLPGISFNIYGDVVHGANASASHLAKQRPSKQSASNPYKTDKNLTKCRPSWEVPDARLRSKLFAKMELRDAASFPPLDSPTPLARRFSSSAGAASPTAAPDNFLYSFDRTESPGRPLTLGVFVKAPTSRETERLVEREYEVLDENGEALKGKRARRVLRAGGGSGVGDGDREGVEDEGFELV